jgi:hypothetical protein
MLLLMSVCYSHNNTFQTCFIFFFFVSPNSSCCIFFELQASSNNGGVGGRKDFKLHLLWRQMYLEDHQDVLQFLLPVTNRISETLQLTSHQMMIITKREREREREREGFIRRFYIPSRDEIMMHGAHGIHPASLVRPVPWFCTGSVFVRADKQDRY